ncbi:MAG: hypothetical protein ACPGAN_05030 [Candidatus Poseidoniaceae archaeon]
MKMADSISISDWKSVVSKFQDTFQNLGLVEISDDKIAFSSIPPSVQTGICISNDGHVISNMPLHEVISRFEDITFTELEIILSSEEFSYTYRIPKEILELRNSK